MRSIKSAPPANTHDRLLRAEARYRDILVHGRNNIRIIYLSGKQEIIASRLAARKGHFMPPGLLTSQFKTLEPPSASGRP